MYLQTTVLFLVASGSSATAILAQRAPSSDLVGRDISQGWSLQTGNSLTFGHSCGNGAYCPISLHCNSMVNNHQVAACCSSSSDCRGEVENAPKCADSSWSLWVGYDGNGFCCEGGLVGVYDISKSVAGTCVSSDNIGSLRPAVLTSTGSGAAATLAVLSASYSSSLAAATQTSASPAATTPTADSTMKAGTSLKTATGGSSAPTTTPDSGGNSSSTTTSSSSSKPTTNGAEKMGLGLSVIGAAVFAVAAL